MRNWRSAEAVGAGRDEDPGRAVRRHRCRLERIRAAGVGYTARARSGVPAAVTVGRGGGRGPEEGAAEDSGQGGSPKRSPAAVREEAARRPKREAPPWEGRDVPNSGASKRMLSWMRI